ncbi:GNAT family N-acetyltransferase [soil metagenome]
MSGSASSQLRHELQPGDIGAVVRLHGTVYAAEQGWDHTFEGYVAEGIGRFAAAFDPARDRLWIAEADGGVVGSIAIVGQADSTAQLRWFVVHPKARGQGLGRQLLAAALSFCRDRHYTSIFLWTAGDLHAAAHLYRSAGFELVEESRHESWGAGNTLQTYRPSPL